MQSRNREGSTRVTTFHSSELPSLEMVRKVMWEHMSDVFSPFLKYENKRNSGRGGIFGPMENRTLDISTMGGGV